MKQSFKSQYGQDKFVAQFFIGKKGFFLDSGAGDGVELSNTYWFEQQGWTGICVEPNEAFYKKLLSNRKCHTINACLFNCDGFVPFTSGGVLGGILSTMEQSHIARIVAQEGNKDIKVEEAPCVLISNVLDQFGPVNQVIDYWSLDTEGSELEILKTFPFHNYKLRSISVEHNWNMYKRTAIGNLLYEQGLVHVGILECDDIYVHKDLL